MKIQAMFYGETLDTVAPLEEVVPPDVSKIEMFSPVLETRQNASLPVLTVGVRGKHARSSIWSKGRSCFNTIEAETVTDICMELIRESISAMANISVISLSRAQTQLIRNELRDVGLSDIRCGTVDDFQGQQSDVVLISCVGSSLQALDMDERRFNVAITRARRLLVVVGSVGVLKNAKAGPWHELAMFCMKREVFLTYDKKQKREAAEDGGGGEAAEVEETDMADESGVTMTRLTDLARTALLGGGNLTSIFPETLYDTHQTMGWAVPDDDLDQPTRVEL